MVVGGADVVAGGSAGSGGGAVETTTSLVVTGTVRGVPADVDGVDRAGGGDVVAETVVVASPVVGGSVEWREVRTTARPNTPIAATPPIPATAAASGRSCHGAFSSGLLSST